MERPNEQPPVAVIFSSETPSSSEQAKKRDSQDVKAPIHFLRRKFQHKSEKPYMLRFVPDDENLPRTNVEFERAENVPITDLRPHLESLNFEKNGIAVMKMDVGMSYEDFSNAAKVELEYLQQLKEHVRLFLDAKSVTVIPHVVGTAGTAGPLAPVESAVAMALYKIRKRHVDFPVSTGASYDYEQPTNIAHVDVSLGELIRTIQRFTVDAEGERIMEGRYQWINVWKPLKGPLTDWPLALCDESSVNLAEDLEPLDLVFPDMFSETVQVYYNENQKWYYLSNQDPSEHLIFRQSDSSIYERSPCVPHSSFPNPLTAATEEPRESIEVKLLVCYNK